MRFTVVEKALGSRGIANRMSMGSLVHAYTYIYLYIICIYIYIYTLG